MLSGAVKATQPMFPPLKGVGGCFSTFPESNKSDGEGVGRRAKSPFSLNGSLDATMEVTWNK